MDTLIRIYLYFIGVIAVLVCFITWVAIRLRAERINRIRDNKARDVMYNELNTLLNEATQISIGIKYDNDNLNTQIEGLNELSKLKQAEITKLEERINRQSDIIKELEQDKENLINCISRTGIRDVKGIVRKCNLGEIQSVISGNHPILKPKPFKKYRSKKPASDFIQSKNYKVDVNVLEQPIIMANSPTADGGVESKQVEPPKPTRDWSVPQAFPEDYIVPVGTEIIAVSDSSSRPLNATGIKGVIDYSIDCIPSCVFGKEQKRMKAMELAPINPLDHPEHPQFNKK